MIPSPLAARFVTDAPVARQLIGLLGALFDNQITGADLVVWGAMLLGVTCGLLGCFVVLRRQSLLGDAIGHAVLPGVCLGFLFAGARSTPALLAGAMAAGLLAAWLISALQRTTLLKSGECMGAVAFGFYGVGILLLTYIQYLKGGQTFLSRLGLGHEIHAGQSGLEKFLFGQIVGISPTDVLYMAIIAALTVAAVILFWRKLAVFSFDPGFAQSIGLNIRLIQQLLTALVTVAIVISIGAVGVVLVAAFLVTPAATAYLLTDRLHRMAALSALLGAASGVGGVFASIALGAFSPDVPTGATMVLTGALFFLAAFLCSPRHGLLPRFARQRQRRRLTQAQNLLRTLYIMFERRGNDDHRFGVHDVAAARQESAAQVGRLWRLAAERQWVDRASADPIILTDLGLAEARQVVRNHRLWELFLTQEANLASDHVHADAERLEHVLSPDVLRRLNALLDNPTADPHGRPIPLPAAGGA